MRKIKERVVVLDMDDTIVQFSSFLCYLHNNLHGTTVTVHDLTEWSFKTLDIEDARGNRVTGKQLIKTFHSYEPHGLYARLPVIEEARFALKILKDLNYKIIIMTARKKQYEKQTFLNVISNNIPYDEILFVPSKDKAKKIRDLSKKYEIILFADDKFETVQEVAETNKVKFVYLINMSSNKLLKPHDNVKRINSVFEAIRDLKDV